MCNYWDFKNNFKIIPSTHHPMLVLKRWHDVIFWKNSQGGQVQLTAENDG